MNSFGVIPSSPYPYNPGSTVGSSGFWVGENVANKVYAIKMLYRLLRGGTSFPSTPPSHVQNSPTYVEVPRKKANTKLTEPNLLIGGRAMPPLTLIPPFFT